MKYCTRCQCELPRFCVIDHEGSNLFHINYAPPLGSTLHYCVDWKMVEHHQENAPRESQWTEDTMDFWRSIDGKYWTVKDVYCECRNYGRPNAIETLVHFVEVEEKSTTPTGSEIGEQAMSEWDEAELRRTVALLADLLEGQETAYHKYTPAQFRHRLRTHWISERESMSRLMEKNIELQKEQECE